MSYFELLAEAVFVSKALEKQLAALQADMEQLRQKENTEDLTRSAAQLQKLQAQWVKLTYLHAVLQLSPCFRLTVNISDLQAGDKKPGHSDAAGWAGGKD